MLARIRMNHRVRNEEGRRAVAIGTSKGNGKDKGNGKGKGKIKGTGT